MTKTGTAARLPRLLGLAEVAEYLEVPRETAKTWNHRGKLPLPVQVLAATPVWTLAQIQPLKKKMQREGYWR